ncbi:MAG: hypothetical protein LBK99_12985 [Opitutaceae bacterium]|nr:hypothetical protein [Opitutaceae bacterium]
MPHSLQIHSSVDRRGAPHTVRHAPPLQPRGTGFQPVDVASPRGTAILAVDGASRRPTREARPVAQASCLPSFLLARSAASIFRPANKTHRASRYSQKCRQEACATPGLDFRPRAKPCPASRLPRSPQAQPCPAPESDLRPQAKSSPASRPDLRLRAQP